MDAGPVQNRDASIDVDPHAPEARLETARRQRGAEGIVWLGMLVVVTLAFALGFITR